MTKPGLWLLLRRNLLRRPLRNGLLALCVAAVAGMQVASALLDRASREGLELGLKRLGADLVAVPRGLAERLTSAFMTGEAALFYMDRKVEKKIASLDFVEKTSPQVYIKSLSGASCCSAWNVFLIGFDPETDFTVRPWLSKNLDHKPGADEIFLGAAFGSEPGQKLKFYGHEFTVAGVLDPTGTGLDATVFIPMESAYQMAEESPEKAVEPLRLKRNQISAVLIRLKPEKEGGLPLYRAAYELETAIPEISVVQPNDLLLKVQKNLSGTLHALRSASYAIWPVTAVLVGLVFAMAAAERGREIGLLRAMGATRNFIFRMILLEAVLVCGLGGVLGSAAALVVMAGFSRLIATSLEVPFYWPGREELLGLLLLSLGIALFTGAFSALFPALNWSRKEPYEAIRRSE